MNYDKKILIIPDTNFLYINYNRKTDFRVYSFNANFSDLIESIEKYNLEDKCAIGLSEVVLEELLIQLIEAYNEQISKLKQLTYNYIFPHLMFDIESFDKFNYIGYITNMRNEVIKTLKKRVVEFVDLPIPDQIKFKSIIRRAFDKRPPFEGSKGKSDKGFKDALLWESILDIKLNNNFSNVIVCSNDQRFCQDELVKEFNQINSSIKIEMVTPQVLNGILKDLVSDMDVADMGINVTQQITDFLNIEQNWLLDLELENLLSLDSGIEYKLLKFDVLDVEEFSIRKYNVLVYATFEIQQDETSKIIKQCKLNVVLQNSDNEWFYIQNFGLGEQHE